jgi:putative endonuclease
VSPQRSKARRPSSRQRTGARGEDLAAVALQERGYSLLVRNYRCTSGEIDIVAMDGETLVFVEVRTRRSDAYGTPEESLTAAKRARMIACAESYVQANPFDGNRRIDVVAVELATDGSVRRLEVIANAVEG